MLKRVGFQHFPQLEQLLSPGLLKFLHVPLAALFAFNQVVAAEFQQKFPHYDRTDAGSTRQLQLGKHLSGAQLTLVNHGEKRLLKETVLLGQRGAGAIEAVLHLRLAKDLIIPSVLTQYAPLAQVAEDMAHGGAADVVHLRQRAL